MDLSTENFNYYEPFDTSSLIKCRNSSTFLISMKSPSLQKLPQSTKKIPHKLPPNPKSANVNKNSISSPEEVSRLRSLIFDEKKELQYQRILETKSLKISQLQEEIKILKKPESNLNISGNMNNELNNHKNNENYEEAIFLLKQNLQYTVEKCSMALKTMISRNNQLFELISLFDSFKRQGLRELDFIHLKEMKDSFQNLMISSQTSSSKDLELVESLKLLQEKNHENLILSSRYEKLLNRCEYFQRKTKESKFHNSNITEDLKLKNKNLHIEETKNLEQSKKVFMLNKLVTVLNSNNPRIIDQNNYKSIINDLIKENENLKRIIVGKEKELAHINEINNKLKNKSSNLSKKIEILQMNLNQNLDAPNNEKNQETWEEDQFSLLSEMKLPLMLDYRNQGVSPVFINMLLDIENQGTEVVFKYLRDDSDGPEERVEVIKTITSQYTSFREFSETVNNLIYHLSKLLSLNNLPDLLTYLSMTLKKVYKCDNVRLWLDDKLTGVLYTYNEKTVMMRSVIGKGYLGKMTDFPLNKIYEKNLLLCEIITENETKKIYVDGLLLIPVGEFFNKSKVILEISGFTMHEVGNLRVKKLDYEYFSIVISTILKGILSKFTKESIIIQERKLKEIWKDSLVDLCSSSSDFNFSERIKYWAERIFNISSSGFLFSEKNFLIKHVSPTSFEEFPNSLGIVGLVSKSKKPVFTANLKNSPQFDSKVDLTTLMSVLTYPLVENIIENNNGIKEKVCLGILQIPIKESGKLKVSEEIGEMREDAEAMAEFFGRIVELAYKYYKKTF